MTLLTAFPTVAQNLGRLSKELIKRIYHCSRISSMITGTVCMLCSSYIICLDTAPSHHLLRNCYSLFYLTASGVPGSDQPGMRAGLGEQRLLTLCSCKQPSKGCLQG
jgi:hypothetical protein